jgi:mannose-6-phosphate isomerase-like protein (cupin superfamily)
MKRIGKSSIIVLFIACFFVACNNEEKKAEPSSGDTTAATSTTDTTTKAPNQDLDAAKIAPGLYTVAKDTMGIRVLNILYKPGDSSAMHSHPDNALYLIDGGKVEFTSPDGSKQVVNMKSGMSGIGGAETHAVKNIGNTTIKGFLVEVTRPNKPGSQDATLDATKVASKYYKLVKDSLRAHYNG